jgi:hypothetical protein
MEVGGRRLLRYTKKDAPKARLLLLFPDHCNVSAGKMPAVHEIYLSVNAGDTL